MRRDEEISAGFARSLGEMETKEAKKKELQRREREWKERTISGLRRKRERTRFGRKKAAGFGNYHFAALLSALIPLRGVA